MTYKVFGGCAGCGVGDPELPAEVTAPRSPWAVLAMFGLLTGMAVYFSKEMDKKKLSRNRRPRKR